MFLGDLHSLLEIATINEERLEIVTHQYGTFTARPVGVNDGNDDLVCDFDDVENWDYNSIDLKDIASVRRVGEVEYAYVANQELVEAV